MTEARCARRARPGPPGQLVAASWLQRSGLTEAAKDGRGGKNKTSVYFQCLKMASWGRFTETQMASNWPRRIQARRERGLGREWGRKRGEIMKMLGNFVDQRLTYRRGVGEWRDVTWKGISLDETAEQTFSLAGITKPPIGRIWGVLIGQRVGGYNFEFYDIFDNFELISTIWSPNNYSTRW